MEKEKLCLRCMRKIGNNTVCPYCRGESNKPQEAPYLPLKAVVGGRYLVGKAISTNSEGFTYNAFDLEQKKAVSLRELFPSGMLTRGDGNYCLVNVGRASDFIDAKDSFTRLWKKLLNITGFTALCTVSDVFEDLGTVYAVSEFLGEGETLREFLLSKEQGYISWEEARVLFMPVVSALGELHSNGIIHGAISPTNLIIDSRGKLRITGFSMPEIRTEKSKMAAELFEGYAAVEQYGLSTGIAPCTDIYGFAAVLYRALIGSTPMSASSRLSNDKLMIPGKFAEMLPAYVINALVNALQIMPEERTPSVELLRNELSASPAAAGTAAQAYAELYEETKPYHAPSEPEVIEEVEEELYEEAYEEFDEAEEEPQGLKKSTIVAFVVSIVICLAILVVVIFGFKGCSNDKNEEEPKDNKPTTEASDKDDINTLKSLKVPDFKGQIYNDFKDDEIYVGVLEFDILLVDSAEPVGSVISQSITPGTEVSSIDKKTITLKVSNGLIVPKFDNNKTVEEVVSQLKDTGFKFIETDAARVASTEDESNMVYSVVYEDETTGKWIQLPADRRLPSDAKIMVYHYGEYDDGSSETEEVTENTDIPDTPEGTEVTDTPDTPETPDVPGGEVVSEQGETAQ